MPEMFWEELFRNLPVYIGAASAFFGGIVFLYKKIVRPIVEARREYQQIIDKVNLIAEEMVPNGGNSLKDVVHRIEKEVALSSERYRAIVADDRSAIFETDSEGNCVWVNRTYAKLTQRLPSELMGHGWVNAIATFDRERVVGGWDTAVKEDREYIDSFSFERPDGTIIPAKVSSYKMVTRDGDTLGYLGICRVIKGEK